MRIEVAVLDYQLDRVKDLLKRNDLVYEEDIDITFIAIDKEIIGTISLSDNVIKCMSVDEEYRGKGVSLLLLNQVIKYLETEKIYHYFAYSKNNNKDIFISLGMRDIVSTDGVTLFEGGINRIDTYLKDMKREYGLTKEYSSIVMNLNPLTNGHLYLIEKASKENDNVIVFVVEEDKSDFPFEFRYELCKKVASRFDNVVVLPSTMYMISRATFSTYFIKDHAEVNKLFAKIDFKIFTDYFAKIFNITSRYIGTEPICKITKAYNEVMLDSDFDIKLVERIKHNDNYISASIVRKLLKEDVSLVKDYVPIETYEMLSAYSKRK